MLRDTSQKVPSANTAQCYLLFNAAVETFISLLCSLSCNFSSLTSLPLLPMPSNISIWLWQWSQFNGDLPQAVHASSSPQNMALNILYQGPTGSGNWPFRGHLGTLRPHLSTESVSFVMETRSFDLYLEKACSTLSISRDLCKAALGLQPKHQQNMEEKKIHGLWSELVFGEMDHFSHHL